MSDWFKTDTSALDTMQSGINSMQELLKQRQAMNPSSEIGLMFDLGKSITNAYKEKRTRDTDADIDSVMSGFDPNTDNPTTVFKALSPLMKNASEDKKKQIDFMVNLFGKEADRGLKAEEIGISKDRLGLEEDKFGYTKQNDAEQLGLQRNQLKSLDQYRVGQNLISATAKNNEAERLKILRQKEAEEQARKQEAYAEKRRDKTAKRNEKLHKMVFGKDANHNASSDESSDIYSLLTNGYIEDGSKVRYTIPEEKRIPALQALLEHANGRLNWSDYDKKELHNHLLGLGKYYDIASDQKIKQ